MLAVDRYDRHADGPGHRHDDLAGGDEHFLAGQRDPLARLDRGEGRQQAYDTGNADNHYIDVRPAHEIADRLDSSGDPKRGRCGLVVQRDRAAELGLLSRQYLRVGVGGQADDPEAIRKPPDYVEGLGSDTARRTQYGDALHTR